MALVAGASNAAASSHTSRASCGNSRITGTLAAISPRASTTASITGVCVAIKILG
jgi:hypothetical protein